MGKTIHIVACGDSARHWDGQGISIGINDAEKFGKRCTYLAIFNHPSKFKGETDRLKVIYASRPQKLFTHARAWKDHFSNIEMVRTTEYAGHIKPGRHYHKRTTPIIAMSIAWNMGATEIVLWGVDLIDHKVYYRGSKYHNSEKTAYISFARQLERYGVRVCLGASGSVLCGHLPVWEQTVEI